MKEREAAEMERSRRHGTTKVMADIPSPISEPTKHTRQRRLGARTTDGAGEGSRRRAWAPATMRVIDSITKTPDQAKAMEMEMVMDSRSHPTPPAMLPSGDIALADATALPLPPPSQQEPASPSPFLSPTRHSPARRRRSKPPRPEPVDQCAGATATHRRKRREAKEPRAEGAMALPGKNVRRSRRRRLESDGGREQTGNEAEVEESAGKARRRKTTAGATAPTGLVLVVKEKDSGLALVPCAPTNRTRGAENVENSDWECLREMLIELVMWKSPARSAFWFGSGSMLFLSSSFSRDINFSPISVLCHFGVVILVLAFIKDSIPQRQHVEQIRSVQLTEEDVRRAARAVLPIANSLISMAQVIFSGDPSMTLKVLPVLLFGAKYGHLLTVWRLLTTGFFSCFTLPKLYSCYSREIHGKAKGLKDRILNAWKSCPRKKLVVAAAVTTCWNLVSVKTCIMAAFISLVTLRYYYQHRRMSKNSEGEICQE